MSKCIRSNKGMSGGIFFSGIRTLWKTSNCQDSIIVQSCITSFNKISVFLNIKRKFNLHVICRRHRIIHVICPVDGSTDAADDDRHPPAEQVAGDYRFRLRWLAKDFIRRWRRLLGFRKLLEYFTERSRNKNKIDCQLTLVQSLILAVISVPR